MLGGFELSSGGFWVFWGVGFGGFQGVDFGGFLVFAAVW